MFLLVKIVSSSVKQRASSRAKLLDAAFTVVRQKGFAATSVDEICVAAGVSKGAFFHNFTSKEAMAVDAAKHWSEMTSALVNGAHYHSLADPLDRVMGYLDFRSVLLTGPVEKFTCLAGTMVQETYRSSDAIRAACASSMLDHIKGLTADLAAAIEARGLIAVSAEGLALHTQVVLQGAFVLAKATGGPQVARESVDHLKHYFRLLFSRETLTQKGNVS